MNIPEQAIEAAIDASLAVRKQGHVSTAGRHYQEIVEALDAAAPFIAAQALRDAAEDMDGLGMETVTAGSLWSRATELATPNA